MKFVAINTDISIASLDESYLSVTSETKLVPWRGLYPVIPNLPDITALDLIKNVMSLFGLFAVADENTMYFYQTEELYDRIPNAKNWSDKLITGSNIESIEYTFGDYARNNYLKYLKDETVPVNADGAIVVANETLENEKDIIELKFAASEEKSSASLFYQNINPVIFIPSYRRNENGEIEYSKATNRIAEMEIRAEDSIARFPGTMYFGGTNGRINTYCKDYQKIVNSPKVIEATFALSNLDLYEIDLLTPVYLDQTGQYYAIIDINFSGGRAKCKLLQI